MGVTDPTRRVGRSAARTEGRRTRPAEGKGQPGAKPAGPGTLLLARPGGGLVALTPEGKEGAELTPPEGTHTNFIGRLSPDGTRAAFVANEASPPANGAARGVAVQGGRQPIRGRGPGRGRGRPAQRCPSPGRPTGRGWW